MKKIKVLFFFNFLLQLFAIYLFTSGFLLINDQVPIAHEKNPIDGSETWFKPKTKVIFFIIDALRFDFFYFNETILGKEQYHFQNKFVKLHNIVKQNPENFIQFKTYADPPTVTVHRIQSMLTGNLPPFVEITENFGSSAISEDNIIRKLSRQNRTIHLVGDYIWTDLFPKEFKVSYPVQSFDIHDLNSVDDVVKDKIFPMVEKNDFDLLIAHMIGNDHIGHLYGIYHQMIGEKLTEMDDMIEKVIQLMDDNTVLFIMGDHGMNDVGDHGGGSKEETETVIGAYYKKGFRKYKNPELEGIMKSYKEDSSSMLIQMDMAPTLAMLFGVPIPYSNTGQMINDFYINEEESGEEFIFTLMRDNYINFLQTSEYMNTAQEKLAKFSLEDFTRVKEIEEEIQEEAREFFKQKDEGKLTKENAIEQGIMIIKKMQSLSREIYSLIQRSNSYDFFFMIIGITLSVFSFFVFFFPLQYLHVQFKSERSREKYNSDISFQELISFIWKESFSKKSLQGILLCLIMGSLAYKLNLLKTVSVLITFLVLWTLYVIARVAIVKTKQFIQDPKEYPSKGFLSKLKMSVFLFDKPFDTILTFIALYFHLALRLSIALTRFERDYLSLMLRNFCYVGLGLILLSSNKVITVTRRLRCAGVLLILIAIFYILPYFDISFQTEAAKAEDYVEPFYYSPYIKVILPLVAFNFLMIKVLLKANIQDKRRRAIVRVSQFLSLTLISLYYILASFEPNYQNNYFIQILLPRIIYITLASAFVGGLLDSKGVKAFSNGEVTCNGKHEKQKENYNGNGKHEKKRISIDYSNEEICVIQLLLLLSGPNAVMAFVLLLVALRLTNYYLIQMEINIILNCCLIGLIIFFGYFCTGHTNQVTNIQVTQGFVGFDHFNYYLSGLLVLLNTMSTFILGLISVHSFLKGSFACNREYKELPASKAKVFCELRANWHWIVFSMFLIAGYVGISINSALNHDSLLLIYDFAPKYFIDTAIYVFLVFCIMFIQVLQDYK